MFFHEFSIKFPNVIFLFKIYEIQFFKIFILISYNNIQQKLKTIYPNIEISTKKKIMKIVNISFFTISFCVFTQNCFALNSATKFKPESFEKPATRPSPHTDAEDDMHKFVPFEEEHVSPIFPHLNFPPPNDNFNLEADQQNPRPLIVTFDDQKKVWVEKKKTAVVAVWIW